MNKEDKKQWLQRYRVLLFEADSLRRQALEWYERLISVPCKPLSDMPRNPSPDKTGDKQIVKHLELVEEANETVELASKARTEINTCINNLHNPKQVELLTYRYLEGKDWQEIAEIMHYTPRSVYNMHQKALDKICID